MIKSKVRKMKINIVTIRYYVILLAYAILYNIRTNLSNKIKRQVNIRFEIKIILF